MLKQDITFSPDSNGNYPAVQTILDDQAVPFDCTLVIKPVTTDQFDQQLTDLQGKLAALQTQMTAWKTDLTNVQAEIDQAQNNTDDLQSQITQIQQEKDNFTKQYPALLATAQAAAQPAQAAQIAQPLSI